jgi:hypothetical protein
MYRISNAAGLATTILVLSVPHANATKNDAESVTIPLDKIWAYGMPGTRDVQELSKEQTTNARRSLFASISESAVIRADKLKWKGAARTGFAVAGTDATALRAAHAVLVEGAKPREVFSSDEKTSLVFFSEPASGARVHLRKVERRGNEIEISYLLDPYIERDVSAAFALIPLGKLPVGKYQVAMRQLPREKFVKPGLKALDEKWGREFVCKPFSFTISEKGE